MEAQGQEQITVPESSEITVPEVENTASETVSTDSETGTISRFKTYTYERNGKKINVKRHWTNTGVRQTKQQELNNYFNNITDLDQSKSVKLLFDEYNDNHELKISYSMFYKKYAEHFGPKRT